MSLSQMGRPEGSPSAWFLLPAGQEAEESACTLGSPTGKAGWLIWGGGAHLPCQFNTPGHVSRPWGDQFWGY